MSHTQCLYLRHLFEGEIIKNSFMGLGGQDLNM